MIAKTLFFILLNINLNTEGFHRQKLSRRIIGQHAVASPLVGRNLARTQNSRIHLQSLKSGRSNVPKLLESTNGHQTKTISHSMLVHSSINQDDHELTMDDIIVITDLIDQNKINEAVTSCLKTHSSRCVENNPWMIAQVGYMENGGNFSHYLEFAKELRREKPNGREWLSVAFSLMSALKKLGRIYGREEVFQLVDWMYLAYHEVGPALSSKNKQLLRLFERFQVPVALQHVCDRRKTVGFPLCTPNNKFALVRQNRGNNAVAGPRHNALLWFRKNETALRIFDTSNTNNILTCHTEDCGEQSWSDMGVGNWDAFWTKFALGRDDAHFAMADKKGHWSSMSEDNSRIISDKSGEKELKDTRYSWSVCV